MQKSLKKISKLIIYSSLSVCLNSFFLSTSLHAENIKNSEKVDATKLNNISNKNLNVISAISTDNINDNYLKPEDAFHFQAYVIGKDKIIAQWVAQDGYHFYHDKFQFFTTSGVLLGQAQIDKGEVVFNKALNKNLEENKGLVNITIPIIAHKPGKFEIISISQGCADTICYPPQKRSVKLQIN